MFCKNWCWYMANQNVKINIFRDNAKFCKQYQMFI